MPLEPRLRNILAEYRHRLVEILGDELDELIVYGSQARGGAEDDSDIDVLCVMKHSFDYGALVLRTAPVSSELGLRHNVVISTTFATRSEYESRQTPFLINVRREGISV